MTLAALTRPTELPPFDALTPEVILPTLDRVIADQDMVVALLLRTKPTTFEGLWMPLERADSAIRALWSAVSHLNSVADSPALRPVYAEGMRRLVESETRLYQNRPLYDLLVALSATPAFAALPRADRVAVERAIRDFTLGGVALEPAARQRYGEIALELSQLATEFGSAVLDATDHWSEHVTDPRLLAGLSKADRAMFAAAAEAKGLDGWLVTLHFPSIRAILTFAENRDLRARVYRASGTRASDQGPDAGRFDNGPRIARILALRHESARLLGFADPVAASLATKMAPDAGSVLDFLRELAERARPIAERELDTLRAFAATELGIDDLQPWDIDYAGEQLRVSRYALDEQAVRAYFPIDCVLQGWRALLERLFGIRLTARDDIALWHPDAAYYDVEDEAGTVFAGLYLDLHARAGKRGGAWMSDARPRLRDGDEVAMPVAYLVCNFAPRGGDVPPLLAHGDVLTLLHETGHCLHHLCTQVDRPNIGGVNGFEWDAVELPSQLMEDFGWDRAVLASMSGHYQSFAPLPQALFDKLLAARRFQSGLSIVRQIEFALFDLVLHLGTLGSDPMEVLEIVREEVAVVRPPEWHRFPHAFSHIFAGGYAAGYYSYLWAEVLAADGFQRFVAAGGIDRTIGDQFRAQVLAHGASRPAAESFRAFRGRDPEIEALLMRRGLA
ncbi:M3 family metallopeptidase [Sphingomonas sp. TDK1]|uniref:M3 family metallopeptidase n=1 Tax=Sphingomonas sp. TDK1 TaxID=453247 RepID=UPI0007D98878|nr:M3 family metallopeptidase [Sphingomonas sp. TDK1]OAN63908.1 oligopeptidase A [Sphingomonas sp. TDK1]